jgi:hypothetical protein
VGIVVSRRLRRAGAAGVSLLILVLLTAPARSEEAAALVFRWPDRLRCEVERRSRMALGERPGSIRDTVDRYQLEASRERGGWVIRRTYLGGIDKRTAAEGAERRELKADRLLPFRVRANGSFAGTVVDAATRERLRAREREWRAQSNASAPLAALTRGVPYAGSEKQLGAQARGEWTDLVEGWMGATLQPGVPLSREARRAVPLPPLGPTMMKVHERWRLVGSVPCAGGGPPSCVELEWVTESDPASLDRAMAVSQREWERAGGQAEGKEAGLSRMELRRTLITDPRTLVPARLTKRMEVQFKSEQERSVHEETTTYACAPSPDL